MCGSATSYPGPSAEEQKYYAMQTSLAQKSQEEYEALEPFYLKAMGIRKTASGGYEEIPWAEQAQTPEGVLAQKQLLMQGYIYNSDGTLRAATEDEMTAGMTATEKQQYEINKATATRTQQALAGTLPIPEVVESKLKEQNRIQEEELARMYGPDWAASTPGQNLKAKQAEQEATVRSAVAQGALDASGALEQINQNITNSMYGNTGNLYGQSYAATSDQYSKMMGYPSRTTGLINVYGNMAGTQAQERANQYTAGLQSAANRNSLFSSLLGTGSQLGSAYLLGDTGDQRFIFNSADDFFSYLESIREMK